MHPLIIEWQIASALLWSSPWRRNFTNCLESVAFSGPKFFNFIFLLRCSRLTKWTWQTVQDDAMWLKCFFCTLFIIYNCWAVWNKISSNTLTAKFSLCCCNLWSMPDHNFVVILFLWYINTWKLIINHSFNEIALRFLQEMQYSLPNTNQIQVLL